MPVLLQLWDASDTSAPKPLAPPKGGEAANASYGYALSSSARDAVGCAFVADATRYARSLARLPRARVHLRVCVCSPCVCVMGCGARV